jgi:hypothetical protein
MMASEASVRPTSQTIIRELVGPGEGDAAVMFSLSPGGLATIRLGAADRKYNSDCWLAATEPRMELPGDLKTALR